MTIDALHSSQVYGFDESGVKWETWNHFIREWPTRQWSGNHGVQMQRKESASQGIQIDTFKLTISSNVD